MPSEYKIGGFTGYELWVVAMLCTGLNPEQIAAKRGVIRASVNYTIRQVFCKTGFTRRSEII
jgi:DNA-binding CsgD family transcriptional regulator